MARKGMITRENIITAAEKVFLKNGYEKTSVKMILEEAHVVTGSFYHFFPSKEALFEAVTERFLAGYTERVTSILHDDNLGITQIIEGLFHELQETADRYYSTLQADHLHWTVQLALHEKTLEALVEPLAYSLHRLQKDGTVRSCLSADDEALARILIKGSEAVLHGGVEKDALRHDPEQTRELLLEFWKRIIAF